MDLTKGEIIAYIVGGLIVIASTLCFIGLSYNFVKNKEAVVVEESK
tara:strand:+ start:79 stop:216 length:138 start_codon:yes stop_codon:yes gene_type:complete